ncbi:hypothetical protein PTSG_07650 [Salpingoeca rosetta]|uniref:Sulfotransferase domain-containing protein n=1 Tax=Salpingoeca rosetta (strain ATCC 50818 / BSB-021) TaxID=946362 RepID=F2UHD4_SALR5|nr:uncharacterized protein PTSG_07650 [Salpingoeca rosetta]EGD76533.1 hypothetical protein PTSG_07650 [Salpingoeca rosetta]|eukprot:XP_004991447.1 hypothetical protein PTSG_07650 [Salpingoeca rosetta]
MTLWSCSWCGWVCMLLMTVVLVGTAGAGGSVTAAIGETTAGHDTTQGEEASTQSLTAAAADDEVVVGVPERDTAYSRVCRISTVAQRLANREPLTIYVAGIHRSASTWQYNTIKMALQLQQLWPLNETTWYYTTSNETRKGLSDRRTASVVLLKVHDFVVHARQATMVFATIRNLVEVGASILHMETTLASERTLLRALDREVQFVSRWMTHTCPCCVQRYPDIVHHEREMTLQLLQTLGLDTEVDVDDVIAGVERLTQARTHNRPSGNVTAFRHDRPKLVEIIEQRFYHWHIQHGL